MWSKAIAKSNSSITLHHQIKCQMICWQTEEDETNPALCSNPIQNRTCTTLCVHWTVCAIHIQCCTVADVRCTTLKKKMLTIMSRRSDHHLLLIQLMSCVPAQLYNSATTKLCISTHRERSYHRHRKKFLLSGGRGVVVVSAGHHCQLPYQLTVSTDVFSALLFLSFLTATISLFVFYFSTRHISAINIHTHTTRRVHKYTRLSTTLPPQ